MSTNINSLKSNKSFIGLARGIVTRCPSYEPDPENRNRIQVCIPSYHGEVDDSKVGTGSSLGKYPWAMMCFSGISPQSTDSYSTDLTDSNSSISLPSDTTSSKSLEELKKLNYDSEYKYCETYNHKLSSAERTELERIVTGEFGTSYIGSCLIAQCLRDAFAMGKCSPLEARNSLGYEGYMTNVSDNAKNAIKYIFDQKGYVVHHRVLYMCTEDYYNKNPGNWHSTQNFLLQYENVLFFDEKSSDSGSTSNSTTISGNNFVPRLSFDDVKQGTQAYKYFYTDNIYTGGVSLPNCTAYAYGRASEILGKDSGLPMNNAGEWVNDLNGKYPVSDTPQLGDVCCWSKRGDCGHVAVVEQIINDNTILISQSGYRDYNRDDPNFWTEKVYKSTVGDGSGKYNKWAYSSNYSLQGFIHIGQFANSSYGISLGSSSGITYDPYPHKGDVVWVTFESGDIRCPIITGTLKPPAGTTVSGGNISDGTLASLASEIILFEEVGSSRVYDSLIGNDNGGLSLGLLGWHEDNGKKIITKIKETDRASFDSATSSELNSKLNVSWSGFIISEGQSIFTTIKRVLGLDASKKVQDIVILEDIQGYFENARNLGITDNAALIYAADLNNQGGLGALQMCYKAASKPVTLDSLHNAAMGTYMGKYETRRNRVREKIKALESSGQLTQVSSASGQAAKVIAIAKKEIGYKAADYGGVTKYGQWYGQYIGCGNDFATAQWCAMFTQWCMYQAGVTKSQVFVTAAAGDSAVAGYRSKGMWHDRKGYTPMSADLIHLVEGHTGFVEAVRNNKVYTIEGNTGASPGCVATHEYDLNDSRIRGYATPKYIL